MGFESSVERKESASHSETNALSERTKTTKTVQSETQFPPTDMNLHIKAWKAKEFAPSTPCSYTYLEAM